MNRQTVLLLVGSGIAAMTVLLMHNRLSDAPPAPAPVPVARVVIAKRDLALGSFVQATQDLDWGTPPPDQQAAATPSENAPETTAPEDGAPKPAAPVNPARENYLYEGSVKLTDFNGAVVRRTLHAGDAVPQQALMKAGEGGFMSAVLEAGMRAVSIAVNATSGNAGFVSPGDHVDLIVTHHVKTSMGSNNQMEESVVSETFVHNVRVVAVDQMLDNPENKAILAKTVTVEVSPRQAEEVAVGAEMGKISLALRSLTQPDPKPEVKKEETEQPPMNDKDRALSELYGAEKGGDNQSRAMDFTRDSDLSQMLGHKSIVVPRVQVIHGDKTENLDFYQDRK